MITYTYYTFYDDTTGRIWASKAMPSTMIIDTENIDQPTSAFISLDQEKGDSPEEWYIDINNNNNLISRPSNSAVIDKLIVVADGLDEAIISGISVGAEVVITDSVESETLIIDDGELRLKSFDADVINIKILGEWPVKDTEFEVTFND